ncbi:MAG: 4a-hydroxytetrahydrobiopterin dehydratase [Alphaproteobacteria bacterium]|nr:4a-hydroxytetrahydrobiopterin dehydratase [Alphaproteobacteria bacterium]MBV8547920.1 4a-hydroxytetrahydrobiopterin dehydratase [Alphaproteobacteria bacterium]
MTTPTDWTNNGDRITRQFTFHDFTQAMAYMVEISFYCEKKNHHPEWKNIYNKLWVELTTHDAGGVTEKDMRLAQHMGDVFARYAKGTGQA